MAKLKGAMHSDEAAGKFSGSMIFRRGKNGAVVTSYYKPGSVRKTSPSSAQIAQREKYGKAVQYWRTFTDEQKAIYNQNAKVLNMSGWNLFFKNYTGSTPPPPPTYEEFTYNGYTYQVGPEFNELIYSKVYSITGAQSNTDGLANSLVLNKLGLNDFPAAKACLIYTDGTNFNWFLPSKDELWAAWLALGRAIFSKDYYWCSNENIGIPFEYAWVLYAKDNEQGSFTKRTSITVRPIRLKN